MRNVSRPRTVAPKRGDLRGDIGAGAAAAGEVPTFGVGDVGDDGTLPLA